RVALDGTVTVLGWAVCAVGIANIGIYIDGVKVGDAQLALPRPDVAGEFPNNPMAHLSGFQCKARIPELAGGTHELLIVVRNGMDDVLEETDTITFNPPVEPRSALSAEPSEFRFELDNPRVVDGVMAEPVTGRLTIEGWVVAQSGISHIEVRLDGQRLGQAHYGLARQDVGIAFPEMPNSLRSGYAFHCPPRSLRSGIHVVTLIVHAKNGTELVHRFDIEVKRPDGEDELVSIRRRITHVEATVLAGVLEDLRFHPRFRLVLRQTGTATLAQLRATVASLRTQIIPDWHLTILPADGQTADGVREVLAECADDLLERIAIADDADMAFADGEDASDETATFYGALCPGDELGCDALAEFAVAAGLHREADFLYADETRFSAASRLREPFFKPDFSPDLLLSTNYIGRPWFAAADLLRRCGISSSTLFSSGEYDLVLRLTENARSVHHVPKLLAKRGPEPRDDEEACHAALAEAANRLGFDAEVLNGCLPGTFRLKRTQRATGKVSIIIPT
ncbi:MAG TPA: hypothetical protein VGC82_01380, partial [Rhodopila sp.]